MENFGSKTTATATVVKEAWKGNFADYAENVDDPNDYKVTVDVPIFILFGEFLGYCSRFAKMASDWCDGIVPELHIQKIMRLEAKAMLRQMKKDYDVKTIRYWFFTYYTPIFKEYEEKLLSVLESD